MPSDLAVRFRSATVGLFMGGHPVIVTPGSGAPAEGRGARSYASGDLISSEVGIEAVEEGEHRGDTDGGAAWRMACSCLPRRSNARTRCTGTVGAAGSYPLSHSAGVNATGLLDSGCWLVAGSEGGNLLMCH